ncbi:hypothetical protein [Dehalococcoides mccartyi]|uniref:hypothetical protein n=1 Tax=Dehalococcoides mccartyi TaxID=61435 RepID=UPI000CDE95B7|nr:hypothetical protein [Dehalococcoides mccartyi]
MDSWQDSFKAGTNLIPALVFLGLNSMIRPLIAPELEQRLGRKLTDWEWEYYLQESYRKAKMDSQQKAIQECRQCLIDRQIILDFVWKG